MYDCEANSFSNGHLAKLDDRNSVLLSDFLKNSKSLISAPNMLSKLLLTVEVSVKV